MKRLTRRHKLTRTRIKIRPMRGPVRVKTPEWGDTDLTEFIGGMGFLIYEDPTDEGLLIITDRAMRYSDFRKSYLCKGSEKWFDKTYAAEMNEELPEYRW